jgi:hypothetical protein
MGCQILDGAFVSCSHEGLLAIGCQVEELWLGRVGSGQSLCARGCTL